MPLFRLKGTGILLPLAAILLLIAQGVFGFTLVPFPFLGKFFFLLLMIPLGRFAYAVYEAKQEWKQKREPLLGAGTRELEGRDAQSEPILRFSGRQVEAGEVVKPPSVTEHTTRRL